MIYFYFKGRYTERNRKIFHLLFQSPSSTTARAELLQSQEPLLDLPWWYRVPRL